MRPTAEATPHSCLNSGVGGLPSASAKTLLDILAKPNNMLVKPNNPRGGQSNRHEVQTIWTGPERTLVFFLSEVNPGHCEAISSTRTRESC